MIISFRCCRRSSITSFSQLSNLSAKFHSVFLCVLWFFADSSFKRRRHARHKLIHQRFLKQHMLTMLHVLTTNCWSSICFSFFQSETSILHLRWVNVMQSSHSLSSFQLAAISLSTFWRRTLADYSFHVAFLFQTSLFFLFLFSSVVCVDWCCCTTRWWSSLRQFRDEYSSSRSQRTLSK